MALAGWRRLYPAELRADFQQYYNLNIDGLGVDYSSAHAADLAVMLPSDSRVFVAINPANKWTMNSHILAATANAVRDLVWLESDAKRRRSNRPKPIEPPTNKEYEYSDIEPIDEEDYLSALETLRGEVNSGRTS